VPLSLAAWFTAYLLWKQIRIALQARRWPARPATVLDSNVTRQMARIGYVYTVRVRVEYALGRNRTASAALPSQFGTTRARYARRLSQFFHVGASVPIYVDPTKPDVAVLLPGVELRDWCVLALVLFVGVGGLVAAIFA
jgi:hypothetical protein